MSEQREQRDMSGALFKAREKRSSKSPDYTGRLVVNGVEYTLSGWVRTPRGGGGKYIGLSVRERSEQRERTDSRSAAAAEEPDVPF